MPKPDEKTPNIMPKVQFHFNAKKQLKCPIVVYADFEAMNVKYNVPEGNKMKLLTKHVATMGCCTVVYSTGEKETITFRNTPDKPCYVAMVEYLNELSLEIRMNYIDHKIISPDWRDRKNLTYKQIELLNSWIELHNSKTHCDICHEKFESYCLPCELKKDNFNSDIFTLFEDYLKNNNFRNCNYDHLEADDIVYLKKRENLQNDSQDMKKKIY